MQTKIPQSDMESVWITGMGLITSIGNDRTSVTGNLRSLKHGIENALMLQGDESPVKVAGTVKGFEVTRHNTKNPEPL